MSFVSRFARKTILCLSLCLAARLLASEAFLSVSRDEISDIVHQMYNLDAEAEKRIARLSQMYPDSPVGPILESGRLFMLQTYDFGDREKREAFEEHTKEALQLAKDYYKRNKDSAEAKYCLAMLELGLARYYIDNRRWFRALFKARSGLARLRKILEEYPDFHDAKLPFGMANCYLDDAPSYLRPFALLFGFKGSMEKGLAQLEDVKANGLFLDLEGASNLAEIHWFLRRDRPAAREELKYLLQRCPDNVMYLRLLGLLEMREKNDREALRYFQTALAKPQIDQFQFMRTEVLLKSGQIHHRSSEFDAALGFAERALESSQEGRTLKQMRSWAFLLRGASLRGRGELEAARESLLLVKESENADAYKQAQSELEKMDLVEDA